MRALARLVLVATAIASAAACDRAKGAGPEGAASARAPVPELDAPVPHVGVTGTNVVLDGEPAGVVTVAGPIAAVPELLAKLRVRHATALYEAKGAAIDPRATIELTEDATAHTLKALLETAGRGGYPTMIVVAARGAEAPWVRAFGYDVPVMPRPRDREDGAATTPPRLLVTAREGAFVVEARSGLAPVAPERTVARNDSQAAASFPELAQAAREVLAGLPKTGGQPRGAVIFVPNAMPIATLRAIAGALDSAEPGIALDVYRSEAPPPAEARRKGAVFVVKSVHVPDGQPPERVFYGLRHAQEPLRACYEAAHAKAPRLRGTLALRFPVGPEGDVGAAKVVPAASTVADPGLAACLGGVLRGITLAKADAPIEATATFEVEFVE